MSKKANVTTNNSTTTSQKGDKTMAKKTTVTTNKAQTKAAKEQVNAAKANARAGIEQVLTIESKCKKALLNAFTNGVYETFDFSKLAKKKVLDVFTDKGFMAVMRALYDASEALKNYEAAYPGYVAEVKKDVMAKVKAEEEARKKAEAEEAAKIAELIKGMSAEELAKALGKESQ